MKNIILYCLVVISTYHTLYGQKTSNNKFEEPTPEQQFESYLDLFTTVSLPFNYKKEMIKVHNTIKLNEIPKKLASSFMHLKNEDFIKIDVLYNMDTDEEQTVQENYLPVAHLKYSNNQFIALISREGIGIKKDSFIVCLRTYDHIGNLIDKAIVGARFTREEDWASSVFIDQFHFKVFQYKINEENYNIQKGYIEVKDNDAPKTVVFETDYEISPEGKITKTKVYPQQYLMDDILEYKSYNPENDDIMNKYNF